MTCWAVSDQSQNSYFWADIFNNSNNNFSYSKENKIFSIHFNVGRISNKVEISTSLDLLLIVVVDGFGKTLVNVVRMTQFMQVVAALLFFSFWGSGVLSVAQVLHLVMRYSNGHLPQAHQMQMPLFLIVAGWK